MRVFLGGSRPNRSIVTAQASLDGEIVGEAKAVVDGRTVSLEMDLIEMYLWWPDDPTLYNLAIKFDGSAGTDEVESYFGLRSVSQADDGELLLNGESYFQRLVLDQGYYPDGIYTAPSEEVLKRDIELAKEMGFNGALLQNPTICEFCYTQLYDIEQERNGLYTYDREPKFDQEIIKEIFQAPAAVEQSND